MDLKELFLKQKQALRARTRQVLELVRPKHLEWRPAPGALTVAEMLRHLAVSEEGVRQVALHNDFSYYEKRIPEGLRSTLGESRALDQLKSDLERVHQQTLSDVSAYPNERLEEERIREALGFRRKVGIILMGINEHEVHHRAQLMTYLRMLGTPAPEPFAAAVRHPRT